MSFSLLLRNRLARAAVLAAVGGALLAPAALDAVEKASAISRMRIRKITEVVRRYQQAGENLADPDVRAAILQEVAEAHPQPVQDRPRQMTTSDVSRIIRQKVAERYPDDLATVERKAVADAQPLFSMSKLLDYVSVGYTQGKKTYYVEGVFYNYGLGGHSINVGGTIIPIFDLMPEYRVKFDAAYCKVQRDLFIQNRIRGYFQRKTQYAGELFSEIRGQVTEENEKDGWIMAWNEWLTPQQVADRFIQGILAQANPTPTEETGPAQPPVAVAQNPAEPAPGETAAPDGAPPGEAVAPVEEGPLQQRIAEAKRQAEQKKIIIANTFTGVDADQGYGLALWEMPRQELALLFQPQIKLESQASVETIEYKEGPIGSIQFFLLNDVFYKVIIDFRVAHPEAMQLLWQRISGNYGESREEYASRERESCLKTAADAILQAFDTPPTPCPERNPVEDHSYKDVMGADGATVAGRVCEKCGTIEPRDIPLENIFTWQGEVTQAMLTIRLNADRSGYERFTLTKENAQLRARLESEIERDRLRRAEEERRRREEEYRQSPDL